MLKDQGVCWTDEIKIGLEGREAVFDGAGLMGAVKSSKGGNPARKSGFRKWSIVTQRTLCDNIVMILRKLNRWR